MTAIPFVRKPDGIPNVRYAMICNADRGKGREDDVFDLADYCWRMKEKGGDNYDEIARKLGVESKGTVSRYISIKEKLCFSVWELARFSFPKNSELGNEVIKNLGNGNVSYRKPWKPWTETHFRALLKHLPLNGQQDNATMRGQLAIIQQCLYRWQKKPKDNKGWNFSKSTNKKRDGRQNPSLQRKTEALTFLVMSL